MMYAVNVGDLNVGIMQGKYLIEIGGWTKLLPGDEKNEEVQEAVRRKWVKLQATEPKPAQKFQPKLDFVKTPIHGSLTIPKTEKKKEKA